MPSKKGILTAKDQLNLEKQRDLLNHHSTQMQFLMNIALAYIALMFSIIFFAIVYMKEGPIKEIGINSLFAFFLVLLILWVIAMKKPTQGYDRLSKKLFSTYDDLGAKL